MEVEEEVRVAPSVTTSMCTDMVSVSCPKCYDDAAGGSEEADRISEASAIITVGRPGEREPFSVSVRLVLLMMMN